jgi:hypothetical protein
VNLVTTAKERILEALRANGKQVCDDCMVGLASLTRRQDSFLNGSKLEKDGLLRRYKDQCALCNKVKTVNTLSGKNATFPSTSQTNPPPTNTEDPKTRLKTPNNGKPWHWEGNVQSILASWLASNGYRLIQVTNTGTHAAGKDIIAIDPDGKEIWVTVKGFPEVKPETSTNPPIQARQWFSGAIFDTILYRNENPEVQIGVALPEGFQTYTTLAQRIQWYKPLVPFTFFWVYEDGSVRVE